MSHDESHRAVRDSPVEAGTRLEREREKEREKVSERERERKRERESLSFIRNNVHNGVVSGAAR